MTAIFAGCSTGVFDIHGTKNPGRKIRGFKQDSQLQRLQNLNTVAEGVSDVEALEAW